MMPGLRLASLVSLLATISFALHTTPQDPEDEDLRGLSVSAPTAMVQENISLAGPCDLTEDLTSAQWVQRFKAEMTAGQRAGVSRLAVLRIGTMGSGKSSSVDKFLAAHLGYDGNMFQIVDLDRMVTSSAKYRELVCQGNAMKPLDGDELGRAWNAAQKSVQGYDAVKTVIDDISSSGLTFSIEQTGRFVCPERKVARFLFKKGYEIIAVVPFVSYHVLKARVEERARIEGRGLSTKELEANFRAFLPNLFRMFQEVDQFYLVDNEVAKDATPKLIFSSQADFTKFDDQACSARFVDGEAMKDLMRRVSDHEDAYNTFAERQLLNLQMLFFANLQYAGQSNLFPEWKVESELTDVLEDLSAFGA